VAGGAVASAIAAGRVESHGLGGCPVFDIAGDIGGWNDYLLLPSRTAVYDGNIKHWSSGAKSSDCPAGIDLRAGETLEWHSGSKWQGNRGGNGYPYINDQG
jgi:hypothetical protein